MPAGWARTNIGELVELVKGINPVDSAAATINGPSVNRNTKGGASGVLHLATGATTGAPTSFTVDAKLQDSDDDVAFADVPSASVAQITAVDSDAETGNIKFRDQPGRKFLRAVVTVAFVGGTTPTIAVAATIALGGSR